MELMFIMELLKVVAWIVGVILVFYTANNIAYIRRNTERQMDILGKLLQITSRHMGL